MRAAWLWLRGLAALVIGAALCAVAWAAWLALTGESIPLLGGKRRSTGGSG